MLSDPMQLSHGRGYDLAVRLRNMLELVKESRDALDEEIAVDTAPGIKSSFLVHVSPYPAVDARTGLPATRYMIWINNVDELVEARTRGEHQARLAMLGETVTGMAHEINQPLNTIALAAQNTLQMIEDPEPDMARVATKLERIVTQVMRASKLIRTMKSHGKLEGEQLERLSLSDSVAEMVELLQPQLAMSKIELQFRPDKYDAYEAIASSIAVQQVLGNVVFNARDAIEDNPERKHEEIIEIRFSRERGAVAVHVSNQGPEIPKDVLSKIFNPFFSTKSRKKDDSGVGLGLSVCSRMMSELGGKISVKSAFGETEFVMSFRAAESARVEESVT